MFADGPNQRSPRFVKTADEQRIDRERMVERQLASRGITNSRVLSAFLKIPRHLFVPDFFKNWAYEDHPIEIGHNQTISQPYIVAFMLEQLELKKGDRVLEIGTGSGYLTALLSELAGQVYSVEIIPELHETARKQLKSLGYPNVNLKLGDGRKGWAEYAPFDKIILSAAADEIPKALIEQLNEHGFLISPLGKSDQSLVLGKKNNGVLAIKHLIPVRFVPLTSNH